ncbi:MAG: primosomal protein N' [Candidatus Omnitrophota bacterium]
MSEAHAVLAQVAVPLPIPTVFSYLIPELLLAKAIPGVRVTVPFRNTEITGYLVGVGKEQGDFSMSSPNVSVGDPELDSRLRGNDKRKSKLKFVLEILDDQPVLSSDMLQLTKWVGEYYGSSWGEAIENALPRWVKYGKKVEKYIEKAKLKNMGPVKTPQEYTLSPEQEKAFEKIKRGLVARDSSLVKNNNESRGTSPESRLFKPMLIYGVTGSGKSELYIRAIRQTLKQNRAAICLVPEIALTEQLQRFFAGHFGDNLEILHSKMTDGERFLTWKRIEIGTCNVVLGPRSAVFAPIPNLGLIIMDEEHEGSYKQETTPRYHAREVAAWRAQNENALFLMGTATPSLESMALAEQGKIDRVDLTERIDSKAMPKVEVIDLKRYQGDKRPSLLFSPPLMREIETNLKNKEGTMLLLNRRGFSTSIRCPQCGKVEECKLCQVSLTFHQEKNLLLCHYCNYQKKVPDVCGECKAPMLRFMGFGTEKVESEIARFFPSARIARMDADTTKKKDSHEKILEKFREQKIDILIGTQMIAKGFDFPHVTLVGVVLADVGLRLPDFRSGERTFQLLTQFAGRAGRGIKPGRVIIQTWMPEHPSIRFAKEHDFLSFYDHEKRCREEFHYPPYRSLVNIIIRSHDEKKAYLFAREIRDVLRNTVGGGRREEGASSLSPSAIHHPPSSGVEIVGPAPLPFYKLRGHFRWHVMLKIPKDLLLTPEIYALLMGLKKPSAVAFQMDVDPLNIL